MKKLTLKHKIVFTAAAAALLFMAAYIISSSAAHAGKSKRLMYFKQTGTQKVEKEIRYIPKSEVETELESYISDLLLGPMVHRVRPLFSIGTELEFCMLKDNVLYIGLSKAAIFQDNEALSFDEGAELLKKNIRKNFHKVDDISIFIDNIFIEPAESMTD